MGILESGIFGNVTGRVGALTFQSYHNCNVVKSTGGNKSNNSESQLSQQAKLSALSPLIKTVYPLILPDFFEYYPRSKSHWDIFMKTNLRLLDVENIYSSFRPGAGRLQQPLNIVSAYQPSTGFFGIAWEDGGLGNTSSDDSVYVIIFSPVNLKAWVSSPATPRLNEIIQLDIGTGYDHSDLKCWLVGYGYRDGNLLAFDSQFSQPAYYPPS